MKRPATLLLALLLSLIFVLAVSCAPNITPSDEESSEIGSEVSSEEKSEASSEIPSEIPSQEESSQEASSKEISSKAEVSSSVTSKVESSSYVPSTPTMPSGKEEDAYYATYVQKTDLGWQLKLVNKYNLLSADVTCAMTDVGSGRLFDSRAVAALDDMVAACRNAGNTLWAQSTFRTLEYQQKLMNNQIQKNLNLGYSRAEAERLSLEWVAPSGGSEHHLGLAVDFNEITESFEYTSSYRWLQAHAHEYGFILRYPRGWEHVTGYHYEPWHYRYIGVEHATAMKEGNFPTFEHYIAYLEEEAAENSDLQG